MTNHISRNRLTLQVSDFRTEAKDVVVLELRDPLRKELPEFTPGSHIELHLPDGVVRQYSICNNSSERDRYSIGVGLARESRGGSKYIHESVRKGDALLVGAPLNNFPLASDASAYCFVAGGIGITPIMSMIKHCIDRGKAWSLFYCARSRQRAAFYEELRSFEALGSVNWHFDDEESGRLFDPARALARISDASKIYCCGPAQLMDSVHSATLDRPADSVHFEWFSPKQQVQVNRKAFTLVTKSSGRRFMIPPDKSILDVLESHGVPVPYSCREGLCGTCQTAVVSGVPDHRDSLLSVEARASNKTMMICVSRSLTDVLELDV